MAESPVSIFRFEYEIQPSGNPWNVFIAAFNAQEAQNHLLRTLNKPIKITASTMISRLDDMSAEVRNNVINAFLASPKGQDMIKRPPAPEPAEPKEVKKK